MRLHIIRHGDPDYVNNTITPAGHLEAEALAKRLSNENIDRIFSSPMGRALHTSQYTAKLINKEPVIEPWTVELADWKYIEDPFEQGKKTQSWKLDGGMLRDHQPRLTTDNWHEHAPLNDPDFLQKFEELKQNSDQFLEKLGYKREGGKYQVLRPNQEKVAVFCHMGFGLAWLAHLLELPLPLIWAGYWLAPSSVTTVLFEERENGFAVPRCLGMGDVSHLYEAGLPVSTQGIIANVD